MTAGDIRRDLPSCCNLSVAPIAAYSREGVSLIRSFFSDTRTVVVTGHRITASLEWAWFPFAAERGGETCAADLHAKSVIEAIERRLAMGAHKSVVLPYPNECGISFKRLAAQTDMGEMGDSFLFLHHEWGPWVHLRVLLTDAVIANGQRDVKKICTHCGNCTKACPGKALSAETHDQQLCGLTQQGLRDALMITAEYSFKCEACARVCPAGEPPQDIEIRDRRPANKAIQPTRYTRG